MATDIVGSLFGVTPEALETTRQQQMREQALALAQLTPQQQITYGASLAGQQFGRGVGGLLGAEDPMLNLVKQRQAVSSTINWADPTSVMSAIAKLKDTDPQGAITLAQELRKMQESGALVAQRNAAANREKQQAIPSSIQVANELAGIDVTEKFLNEQPDSPDKDQALRVLKIRKDALTKQQPSYAPTELQKLQEYRKDLQDQKAPQSQIDEVNALIKSLPGKGQSANITNILGDKKIESIPDFRTKVIATIKPQLNVVDSTDQALEQLQLSVNENNPAAFNAARLQLAKAIGGGTDISNKEIQAAGGDPSIYGKLIDTTSVLFTGTPSTETQKNIEKTLRALQMVAKKKAKDEIKVQIRLGVNSKIGSESELNEAFDFPQLRDKTDIGTDVQARAKALLEERRKKQSQPK
jgi:hypothetical protein